MIAHLRSVRIAPKKANLIAKMVRGMPVPEALVLLEHTTKKSARIFEKLLKSAMANAEHNAKQDPKKMIIKTVIVNQGTAYQRGVPMARGRVRPIRKFLSHITIQLGIDEPKDEKSQKIQKNEKSETNKKSTTNAKSATNEKNITKVTSAKDTKKKSSQSSPSSTSSHSS